MRTSRCRLFLLTLALAAALAVPSIGAGERTATPTPAARTGGPAGGIDLLSAAWSRFRSYWLDAGCILDPSGGCAAYAAAPALLRGRGAYRPDAGCILDPDGGCAYGAARRTVAGANRRSGADPGAAGSPGQR